MAPDAQPTAPVGLRPETAVICAGRPGHAASAPLNVPMVLASNFHASTDVCVWIGTLDESCNHLPRHVKLPRLAQEC